MEKVVEREVRPAAGPRSGQPCEPWWSLNISYEQWQDIEEFQVESWHDLL